MYDISQTHLTCILYTEHQSHVSAPGPMALLLAPLAKGQQAIVMALCPSCLRSFVRPSVRPSIYTWTQFCTELFSYSFARIALKFIHNLCVHMKLCMCNFHDHTIIGCGIMFP